MGFIVKVYDEVCADYQEDYQQNVINNEIMEHQEEIKEPEKIERVGGIVKSEFRVR
jgi:hypothetical protein